MTADAAPEGGNTSSIDSAAPLDVAAFITTCRQRADQFAAAGDAENSAHFRQLARTVEDEWWQDYFERGREKYRSDLRMWEAANAHYDAWQLENVRGVLGFAQAGLKGFTLVNAGAIVALLAFLGNVWGKGVRGGPFISALCLFALGLFMAVLSTGLSYYTQLLYSSKDEAVQVRGATTHRVTAVAALLSLLLFAIGAWQSIVAFRAQPALRDPPPTQVEHADEEPAASATAATTTTSATATSNPTAAASAAEAVADPAK